jgi:TonB-linked SusC/RagA family outer membrane protein
MRLTIIFFLAGIFHVNAHSYGQQVTLNRSNVTIKQIFKAVKEQTGYDVLWQPKQLDANVRIDAHFNSTPVDHVIQECISKQGLVFEIQDASIVIKLNEKIRNVPLERDSAIYKGRVTDENGKPMPGATVKVRGSKRITFTTSQGTFAIYGPSKGALEFSFIGYLTNQITLNGLSPTNEINVQMIPGSNSLGEVNIVSTGYQDIAKERATGSFEVITKEQLQHSSDPNLIKRLEGITTSMNFNNNLTPINSAALPTAATNPINSPLAKLTIRGRNTLNEVGSSNNSGQVLVVIDGVASPYSIDYINPDNVESITVLKDAAAASIWGSRAANGVLVVKTKRGNYEKPVNISFITNFNITEKLNLFYRKTMTTSEYVDAQIYQFTVGGTNIGTPDLSQPQPLYSPVAEILGQRNRGEISPIQASAQLDALRSNDIRKDYSRYILRDAITQNYSLSLEGGSKKIAYRVSGSYNKTLNNTVASGLDRLTFDYNTSFKPLKNLEVNANIGYSQSTTDGQARENPISALIEGPYYLYTRLADDQGNLLSIPYKYRTAFKNLLNSTYGSAIQDLTFTPLNEVKEGSYKTDYKSLNFNLGAAYRLSNLLSVNVIYNYNKGNGKEEILNKQNSFFMRDLITFYTTTTGVKQLPLGGLYRPSFANSSYHSIRPQINANSTWGKHAFNAIAGVELTQNYSISVSNQYFGYNEKTLVYNNLLNYTSGVNTLFNDSFGLPISLLPSYVASNFVDSRKRTYSYYSNGAYTYNDRYTLSASVRKDMSSQFGTGANKQGAPFYSMGASWNIANEDFYRLASIPKLQLRTTFGYNGNVNPLILAQSVITYSTGNGLNGLRYATATSGRGVTNSQLRPEKTAVYNIGLDFGFKNDWLAGSFEYYRKYTTDLLTSNFLDPSTGFASAVYNTGNLRGEGIDFSLRSRNLQSGLFSWSSSLLFSYNRVKVTKIYTPSPKSAGDVVAGSLSFEEGADLSRLYAYKWAGLDPATGNPRVFVNGQPLAVNGSNAYLSIINQPKSSARYMGSAVPVYYGALRNTFAYGPLAVSASILYKFGYYFRRPGNQIVRYTALFNNGTVQGAEYSKRWQKPGDELITNVPSQLYPADQLREVVYQLSDLNVLKADHIRLQEINLSYSLSNKKWFLKNPRFFSNINNLGVIWRANRLGLDPDINDYPNPKTYAFGFSANF